MITTSNIEIRHNSLDGEVTVALDSSCDHIPGLVLEHDLEGTGENLADALHDLASQVSDLSGSEQS